MIWIAIAAIPFLFLVACLTGAVIRLSRQAEEVDAALVAAHHRINELEAGRLRDLAQVRQIAIGLQQLTGVVGWLARQHGAIVVQTDAKGRAN